MTKDEALKLALEALENSVDLVREDAYEAEKLYGNYPTRQGKVNGLKVLADDHEKAITAIKEALAQQEQEPVALEEKFSLLLWDYQELERAFEKVTGGKWVRKSNTPQRKPLTDDELSDIWFKQSVDWMEFARAIEAAHNIKEKNI